MKYNQFDLQVLVHGRPIREYEHDGSVFVEGRKGSEFTIRIRNFSSQRVLAVVTVDGLSVLDGKPGTYDGSGGYIVNANQSIDIPGWRLNDSEVAKFVFDKITQSYSVQSNNGEHNVGVIGVAIFNEMPRFSYRWCDNNGTTPWVSGKIGDITYTSSTLSNTLHTKGSSSNTLHTKGSSVFVSQHQDVTSNCSGILREKAASHRVEEVSFVKASQHPNALLSIYYNSWDNLKRAGVIKTKTSEVCNRPEPFPKSITGCTPPDGWKR